MRQMKESWWSRTSQDLQAAAGRKEMKSFFSGLKAVCGPCKASGMTPIRSKDNTTLLTDKAAILERWASHFNSVLCHQSNIDSTAIGALPQIPIQEELSDAPRSNGIDKAVWQMSCGKAPGAEGITAEIFKQGGHHLTQHLEYLFGAIWEQETVPQDFRDATFVHLYKRKGDCACCDNHRGISLLSVAEKIQARVLLNRLNHHVTQQHILPESQCGFRAGSGTVDMIFSVRQLQEKCREQNRDLYLVSADLIKAFDSINCEGLWKILGKVGCTTKFFNIICSFHEGMMTHVLDGGEGLSPFAVTNGTEQGCVLAPVLFGIVFAAMLHVAFAGCDRGVTIVSRCDGGIFNLRRLQARTKVTESTLSNFLFADDCALAAHSLEDIQHITDRVAVASQRFGLTISLKKTEVLLQPKPGALYVQPSVTVDGSPLKAVDSFCYLGSVVFQNAMINDEVNARIAKASAAFGNMQGRLWSDHGVRLSTEIAVDRAVVLTTLLYGCESWTPYRRHINQLDQFHMHYLRRIANIKWQDKVPNTDVLKRCNTTGIEALIMTARFRWLVIFRGWTIPESQKLSSMAN
ncbi:uncharacterized protein LOC119739049 [Patiria miniata]|uniref:Reverse transcriptase domain-containing protein n=1 Tax=Patiria miniata TaxID=46514 RepID=A0A914B2T7_PATMI|nr:uncharacterized protein LOC119739049 [Patiria miniata]